jgi:hypothetical protein
MSARRPPSQADYLESVTLEGARDIRQPEHRWM